MQQQSTQQQQLQQELNAMQYQGAQNTFMKAQGSFNYTPIPSWPYITQAGLNSEVFETPLDTLVNLWLNRYGGGWVNMADVIEEEFYTLAAQRLIQTSRMEAFTLSDVGKRVLRVVQ
jgi:hypothetical protein